MATSRPKIIKSFGEPLDIRMRYLDYEFGSDPSTYDASKFFRANFVNFFRSTIGFPSKTIIFGGFSREARGKTWRRRHCSDRSQIRNLPSS